MRNYDSGFRDRFLNLQTIAAFGLLLCFFGLGLESVHAQKAQTDRPNAQKSEPGDFKIYDVDCDYGTLAFKGRVERADLGDQYLYGIQIAVVFLPGELTHDGYTVTNRTKVADLKFCEMVATLKVEEGKPYKLLHREYHRIELRLTEDGEVGVLPELEFLMPKSAVENASHVGLGVIGSGNLAWPIPVELK